MSFATRLVINCAGQGSEKVAQLAGIDTEKAGYQLYINSAAGRVGYTMGMKKSALLTTTMEPCPIWKGPSVSCTIDGMMRVSTGGFSAPRVRLAGSDTFDALVRKYTIEYESRAADPQNKQHVYDVVKSNLPFLEFDDLEPAEFTGCPDPSFEGYMGTTDWLIREESDKGLPGFINMTSITSPAFTSSLAIAEYVRDLLKEWLD